MVIIDLILIFLFIQKNKAQIQYYPKHLADDKYPFGLPSTCNNYYYFVIASTYIIRINKDTDERECDGHSSLLTYSNSIIYCADKSNNSYYFYQQKFYSIKCNINYISLSLFSQNSYSGNYIGSITLENEIAIYGINSNKLVILKQKDDNDFQQYEFDIENMQKVSCKYLGYKKFICAININDDIQIYILNYENNDVYYFSTGYDTKELALYDTTISLTTKILCRQDKGNDKKVICYFFRINNLDDNRGNSEYGQESLIFISKVNDFSEKDCCFSEFNNEYLFCCGIKDYIICYRINENLSIIKQFNPSISGRNTYLSIITDNLCATFFFMNGTTNIYEYKICIPNCIYKEYSFYNSLNENKINSEKEKLDNLFEIKTNNIYLSFDDAPYDFGYFSLQKYSYIDKITNSSKIKIGYNDYIINFNITNKEKINFNAIIINYTLSIDNDEAYTKKCQIKFNFPLPLCYDSCETCSIDIYSSNNTNHNCEKCKENYFPSPIIKSNCYTLEEKEINWYFNSDKKEFGLCDEDCKSCSGPSKNECLSCYNNLYLYLGHCQNQNESDFSANLINESYNYTKNDFKQLMKELEIYEQNKRQNMSKEEEIKYYNNLMKIIEKIFTDNYDTSNMDNGEYQIIKTEKMNITLTTLQNQNIDTNQNMTTIDLGTCENLLRNYYNLSNNETLYMKKYDVFQEGYSIPKVEFDIYSKLSETNLTKLNLTVCKNSKIKISIPIKLSENIDKLNPKSDYYNDICYTTTSEYDTDITLKDRKNDFIDKNKTLCQDDCEFLNYDNEKNKVECSCNVKESSSSIADIKINKAELLKNFKDIKNIANLNFLLCYKKLFNKDGIINNIGCYILIFIIIFHIISIFVFYLNDFKIIKKKIEEIIFGINKEKIFDKNEKCKIDEYKNKPNEISIYNKNKKRKKSGKKQIKNKKIKDNNTNLKIISKNNKINKSSDDKEEKNLSNYIEDEINELSYHLAIKYDKRVFCQYYNSLIKAKHNLIFAFFNNNDYNSKIIKIDLFFIGYSIEYIVNALFYNDDTMHKIYKSKGEFDFEYQIPIVVYSTLISTVVNTPLNFLSLTNDAIIDFKQDKSKNNIMKNAKSLENKLKARVILFFILGFLFLYCFWYYISMFCVIYKNTQMHLLKDTLMSFGLSLIFPFGYYLLPGFFRIPALSNSKNKRECLYSFSKFLQPF